jgi:SNF2 family DNA or RNA helicase
MDLPPKVYRMLNVDLTDEQSRMYRAMRDNAFVEFEGGFTSSTQAIVTLTRLQQIVCGHIADEDGDVHSIKSNRVSAMMEDLEGVSGGTIVWSRWRHEIAATVEALRSAYGEESVAEYHGGNTNTREDDARRFINSDRCRFMVSTQQSGGYGNTWLKGTYTYYMSNSFNLEHRVQSEDRPHRGGQTEKCTYTDLRAIGTVDERLIAALRAKINVAASIQGEDPRAWLV